MQSCCVICINVYYCYAAVTNIIGTRLSKWHIQKPVKHACTMTFRCGLRNTLKENTELNLHGKHKLSCCAVNWQPHCRSIGQMLLLLSSDMFAVYGVALK